jgi:phosphatidylserine decarboxylase
MDGMSDNDQLVACSTANPSEFLSTMDDEDIQRAKTAFSNMIDQTCSNSQGHIFEHTFIPQDSFAFLFRSIIPKQETIKQDYEHILPQNFFKFQDREGLKYAFQVLDRRTNRLTYEQMPSYHKYGMKLIFSGPVQRELLHTNTIRNFFARETLRLGEAFDEPKSRKHIPAFVKMYQIDLGELLEPNILKYFTFNEFFYRKLKPDARPIDNPDDPYGIVSAADCRLILFDNISEATRIWIKGQQFSLRYLFEDEKLAKEFDGGSIAVFRLAPVDYHRFHSPIKGIIGKYMKKITGTYYTVNPIAIKENLDVLTRNQRTVITIKNDSFERIAFVAIGALLVGSVNFTVKPDQPIEKGDELGDT